VAPSHVAALAAGAVRVQPMFPVRDRRDIAQIQADLKAAKRRRVGGEEGAEAVSGGGGGEAGGGAATAAAVDASREPEADKT